ncbi:TerD family protein [Kibdelosporangium persicum]|uniref:TerD domain n=1 Tax=Kibdelosporangium persicum TaxID=2698649 RepID=A0ABX2F115_9PSEU|nr:TerD family protein [Kibdelosporangium persicum]NRN65006.1 TerD domain [Kibdelosporangium persicum]
MTDPKVLISKTLRVPRSEGPRGDGAGVARQMDAALAGVGFKASRELLEYVATLEPGAAMDLAIDVIGAVRGLVGDNVPHNAYFINFPDGVPDTVEFWVQCLRDALVPARRKWFPRDADLVDVLTGGWVDLLKLPRYGRYQHTYEELLAAHDELIPSVKDRVTVLHLGGTVQEEASRAYLGLAGSVTPLGEADLQVLADLAETCLAGTQPEVIPVRENRAVVNAVRMRAGLPLVSVDTVTDVLRVACQASGGDVTLRERTKFRSFKRRERRVMLAALDAVVAGNSGKLGDVARFAGPWKRLGELLHPHEYPRFPNAQDVFAVARGERKVRSLAGRAELAFMTDGAVRAATVLANAPGLLVRSLDRLLREANADDVEVILAGAESALGSVSGRVLCSLREHFANRGTPDPARVFTTRGRRSWVATDNRKRLPRKVIHRVTSMLDLELLARVPTYERLVVDPAVLDVALPLSGKATEDGFAVLPRGTRTRVDGDVLRFFTYWRQRQQRTDYDLSALLLDEDFRYAGHVSWTKYGTEGVVYSGDVTGAAKGATEFIDITLDKVEAAFVVPQVNIYSGEGFDQVEESMFGWMTRERDQRGAPFEARTVRTRSDMRGSGRVALPVMFARDGDGQWSATWMHLYLSGRVNFNVVEGNRVSTAILARGLYERDYLTMSYLVDMLTAKAGSVTMWEPGLKLTEPVVFVGLDRPEGLPDGSEVFTRDRLNQLIPA